MSRPAVSFFVWSSRPMSWLAPFVPLALRSSRLSPSVIATMAAADFPRLLSPGISLGQCQTCPLAPSGSTCAVDNSGASLFLANSPAVARLTAGSCSYGRRFASGPFARVPCGSRLAVRLRLSLSPRRVPFTPIGLAPARHTRAGFPACRFTGLSSPVHLSWRLESRRNRQTRMSALRTRPPS